MAKLTDIQIRNWTKAGNPIAKADGAGLTLSAKGTPRGYYAIVQQEQNHRNK